MKSGTPWFRRVAIRVLFVAVALNGIGCTNRSAPEPLRYPLQGKADYDGRPIANGEILFSPDVEAGNSGPGSLAIIKDGKYLLNRNQGIVGGAYVVEITAFHASDPKLVDAGGEPGLRRVLFPRYQLRVELPSGGEFNVSVPASNVPSP